MAVSAGVVADADISHSSQASICPPKADVLHFLMQIKFLIMEFNPKSSNFEPNLFKTSATY